MPPAKRPRAAAEDPETTAGASAAAEGSSTASSAASEPRPSGNGFFSDPGPGFDAQAASQAPQPEPEVLDPGFWQEDTVRGLLEAKGTALHAVIGKADTDWIYTRDELRAIAGPLTRILNRYPATQAAAGSGDELAVIIGLTGYTTRSIRERQAALKAGQPEPEPEEQPLQPPVFTADQPPIPPTQ